MTSKAISYILDDPYFHYRLSAHQQALLRKLFNLEVDKHH